MHGGIYIRTRLLLFSSSKHNRYIPMYIFYSQQKKVDLKILKINQFIYLMTNNNLVGSALDHRSLPPEFEYRRGNI